MRELKYRRLMLVAFNKHAREENCFHVVAELNPDVHWTFDLIQAQVLRPMFHTIYSKMIPTMPSLGNDGHGNPTEKGMQALCEWEEKYFGAPDPP